MFAGYFQDWDLEISFSPSLMKNLRRNLLDHGTSIFKFSIHIYFFHPPPYIFLCVNFKIMHIWNKFHTWSSATMGYCWNGYASCLSSCRWERQRTRATAFVLLRLIFSVNIKTECWSTVLFPLDFPNCCPPADPLVLISVKFQPFYPYFQLHFLWLLFATLSHWSYSTSVWRFIGPP